MPTFMTAANNNTVTHRRRCRKSRPYTVHIVLASVVLLMPVIGYFGLQAFEQKRVFLPDATMAGTPDGVGLAYQAVELNTMDGETLAAWFLPQPSTNAPVLLLAHGNNGNISTRLALLALLHRSGAALLIFDYRGYGESSGSPSEAGTYADALAAWLYLTETRRIAPQRIVIHGRSLGGPVAAWLAAQVEPAGLILESTFTDMTALGEHHYPWLPVRLIGKLRYPTLDYLAGVQAPVLVIHSPDDELVPFAHGKALHSAVQGTADLLILEGNHQSGYRCCPEHYVNGLRQFIDTATAASRLPSAGAFSPVRSN